MAQHGREIAGDMRAVGQAVADGTKSLLALAVVVGVAVLREGSEVLLFLYVIEASNGGSAASLAIGGITGPALGGAVCLLTYFGLMRIPARPLFATTTVMITLLAGAWQRRPWHSSNAPTGSQHWIRWFGTVRGCFRT
jgi:high-affinity iron transporter